MSRIASRTMGTLLALSLIAVAGAAQASVIGQWTGSARSWNAADFSIIHATMTGAGHVIEADGAITAANLANDDMFVIGEATSGLSATEAADLLSWVSGGGVLWVGVDSSSNVALSNSILTGLGSTMSYLASNTGTGGPLAAGNFATDFIFDIVGQNLTLSLAKEVVIGGGLALSGDVLGVEQIGSGWVFVSGDRFEQNFSNSTPASVNGQLLLNIAGFAMQQVPEPGTLLLAGGGLLLALGVRRRRSR